MAIGNSVSDEIREQRRKVMLEGGFKEKLAYFFYYYKFHALTVAAVTVFLILLIVNFATKKENILQVVYVNGFPNTDTQEFMNDFAKTIEFNPKKESVNLDDSFYISSGEQTVYDQNNEEKLFIMSSAGSIDVCVTDESYLNSLLTNGYLLDLSTVLSEAQMEKYKDNLIYFDSEEDMHEGELPVAIRITDAAKIQSTNCFPNTDCYFTIIMNSEHIDNSLAFLDYLETP